uniref:Elongation of very long chain fatty acids protein n=1 Tax=Plectus sambesii TaxID=2011161 RepID=A0A914V3X6_9BILA
MTHWAMDSANFDESAVRRWMLDHWTTGIYISIGYVITLIALKRWMENRQPFTLTAPLIAWNFLLGVFSIMGTTVLADDFFSVLKRLGFHDSYCYTGDYFKGQNGYWVFLFALSKIAELGDTLFLALRKRPVLFLHWYHHATVSAFSWVIYPYHPSVWRWIVGINYSIHAIMYPYYMFKAMGVKLPGFIPRIITAMQIAQFFIDIYIMVDLTKRAFNGTVGDCGLPPTWGCLVGLGLVISFLVLFMNYSYHSYFKRGGKHNRSKID